MTDTLPTGNDLVLDPARLDDLPYAALLAPDVAEAVCLHCSSVAKPADGRCGDCGALLLVVCSGCGTASSPKARFCAECGSRLAALIADAPRELLATQPARELRPLTVLFADLVGSSALAAALDPEEYTEIVGAFLRAVSATGTRHGGYLGRFVGDAAVVYFGYPTTQEDDAERAVRAALAIVDAIATLPPRGRQRLDVRVGLSNGLVTVGDVTGTGDRRNTDVYGETPNLAARLQALAEPGAVLVSESVRRLVGGLFEFRDRGAHLIKGWPEPVAVWQALRSRRDVSRFAGRGGATTSPLFGRKAPLARLRSLWQAAQSGEGRAVLITGEAGIGKSRLVEELLCETPLESLLRYFTAPHQQAMTLQPTINQLERNGRMASRDLPALRLAKLRALLPDAQATDFALIAELLLIRDSSLPPLPAMAPQRRRERLLQALFGTLAAAARRRPILAVCEDAHWADPATLELLHMTAQRLAGLPVLLIVTARPEYQPSWLAGQNAECLALDQLGLEDSAALVRASARDVPLPLGTVRDIVHRSDGLPLHIEELTWAVTESVAQGDTTKSVAQGDSAKSVTQGDSAKSVTQGDSAKSVAQGDNAKSVTQGDNAVGARRPRERVPASLRASLLARLDRLGPAREVAEVAAVIGREFSIALLALVLGCEEAALDPSLERLKESGIVLRGGSGPSTTHRFKHALLQDAAESMITRARYRALHARVADLLEAQGSNAAAAVQPNLLAHHRTEAGQFEQAVAWWLRGAREALLRSAAEEALVQLRRGINLVQELPDAPARHEAELKLQLLAGNALLVTKGHAARETGEAFVCARAICDRLPGTPLLVEAMSGQWFNALMRGELGLAERRAEELLAIGEQTGVGHWLLIGRRAVGYNSYLRGDFVLSVAMLQRAVGCVDPAQHHVRITLHDAKISAHRFVSWGIMWLGRLGASRHEAEEALRDARAVGHLYTIAHALITVAYIDINTGAEEQGLAGMQEALRFSELHGAPYFEMVSKILCGVAIGRRGDPEVGLAMVREGIAWHRATDSYAYLPGFLASEGELMALAGDPAGGLARFDEAFARMEASEARWDEAELHRQRGEVLRLAGRAAETELRRAVDIAAASGSRLRQLQCGLSLAGLLADDGRHDAARGVLAPVLTALADEEAPVLAQARSLFDKMM